MAKPWNLEKETETLLIPLCSRAQWNGRGFLDDNYAAPTLRALHISCNKISIPTKTQLSLAIRSSILDEETTFYLRAHPGCTVLSLGSGLDTRYARLTGWGSWIDLDLPPVAQLRVSLLPPREHHRTIAASATDSDWLSQLEPTNEPVLVLAEGLLMYLSEEAVMTLCSHLVRYFPRLTLVFDVFSAAILRAIRFQPSLRKTGAVIRWGANTPALIEQAVPGLLYQRTRYLTEESYVQKLPGVWQFSFRLAGRIKGAREAHRIWIFTAAQTEK